MANTYKNIVITPNTGSTTGDPTIVFSGGDSSTNTDIELVVYPTSNGTLSFEGTAGQLFSITNDLSNTIFSVNDVSGLPLIEVNVASQQITLGQYYGNVGIGTAAGNSSNYKLDVAGGANISLPNLTVGGTNVIAAIVASNANAVTLSANVNTLAAAVVAANSTSTSNNASQGANIAVLAASFVSNSQTLSANVNVLAASFVSNSQTLSANVNTLAAAVISNNATQGANIAALAANVNTIAGAITNLTLENIPSAFVKRSVSAATTANIALYGTQTIDGVAVSAGNRVLVKDQTLANQNGLYVVSATAWSRSTDADIIGDIASALVAVDAGTVNGGRLYDNDTKITDTLNTTNIVWGRVIDDGAIYTYAAPVTAYGALNVAYLAANTNAQTLSANVNVLAATFAGANANNISLSANVNTLAASFVSNSQTLSANVNTLAATFVAANANNISLSANVNTLAATFVSNSQSLSANLNTWAAPKASPTFTGSVSVPSAGLGVGAASPGTATNIYMYGATGSTYRIIRNAGNSIGFLNLASTGFSMSLNGDNMSVTGDLTVVGTGGRTLLATLTAASSATLSTTALTGYRYIEILFSNIVPVTTSTILQLQWYTTAYQTTGYQNYMAIFNGAGSAATQQTTYVDLSGGARVSSTASNGFTGRVLLLNANQATGFKQYIIDSGGLDSTTAGYNRCWGTGQLNVTAAITGFQMYMSSGNISTGVVQVWGWN